MRKNGKIKHKMHIFLCKLTHIRRMVVKNKMKYEKQYRVYNIGTLTCIGIILFIFASITVYVDPVFHYHAPLQGWGYELFDERYQNDGIVRHFDYDTIITGTSMTENFKTSLCDELFNTHAIKVPFSGAPYKEINENLERAFEANRNISMVIRCLDYNSLQYEAKDDVWHGVVEDGYVFPSYLTDNCITNDVSYFWNKSIFLNYTMRTIQYKNNEMTSFDEYCQWKDAEYGANVIREKYNRREKIEWHNTMQKNDKERIQELIEQNVLALCRQNPDTEFYLFFPPYSICYWDDKYRLGDVDLIIDEENYATELLLECSNIRLFSFNENFDVISNLDNYTDMLHYGSWINDDMLQWMHDGKYEITKDNYEQHIENIREFYNNYDYDSIYE